MVRNELQDNPLSGHGYVFINRAGTRARSHIDKTLGNHFNGTLLTDGYSAYNSYVAKQKELNNILVHAACWAHARRKFEQAQDNYPESGDALKLLARVYKAEADIRQKGLIWNHRAGLPRRLNTRLVKSTNYRCFYLIQMCRLIITIPKDV